MAAPTLSELRRNQRIPCKIRAKLRYMGHEARAVVLDVSKTGLRLYIGADIGASVGKPVVVETEELGQLTGEIRWVRFPRLGVTLHKSTNTAAKIASYFRTIE